MQFTPLLLQVPTVFAKCKIELVLRQISCLKTLKNEMQRFLRALFHLIL